MWWSKASKSESSVGESVEQEAPPPPLPDRQFDQAVDTIGAMLRAMGEHAVDTDVREAGSIRSSCEGWARHVLVLAPPPGAPATERPTTARREWVSVRRFAAELVREQNDYAQRALASLRDAVWVFVGTLSDAVAEDRGADTHVQERLERLRVVVESASPEQLRAEVAAAVETISHVLHERNRKRVSGMAELGRRLRTLGRELEQAKREGATDPLTRVLNRKAFDEFAERTTQLAALFQTPACLLMVDLDHFKLVNDTHGHQAGDEVLKMVADSLARCFLRKGDFVARYGGEEFAVILSETEVRDAGMLSARMCTAVAASSVTRGDTVIRVTCSVGVAQVIPSETPADWIARADAALYAAKHQGRNRVVLAGDSPQTLTAGPVQASPARLRSQARAVG